MCWPIAYSIFLARHLWDMVSLIPQESSIRSHEEDSLNIQIRNPAVTATEISRRALWSPACFIKTLQSI